MSIIKEKGARQNEGEPRRPARGDLTKTMWTGRSATGSADCDSCLPARAGAGQTLPSERRTDSSG
ncbi:hypothetical protein A2823_01840 [Candidatus Nomurabacteria bacterium RIFCSPHIGHO2_01_FULL_41_91]|uniref:Uncharacterized protein n=1 Tax=Candidatus Nomurabacteria bacterium RIFCSPLOWO2_12_FULL_41_10 TaxID=1801795 RepID=A0A1F6Y9Z8_9BACT|nr:MAG: hypothetical protein A2823_01840 [Candidatus Nomurabacteria bacterium RIFCSPHIGHO2_01_FULL_41_91]OGI80281.1 MAG: hypothetical protein A3D43_01225 [Candidatus Nomurabacteria bacterium RIFCSPHIGHO2_02_FULL_41_52]OGI84985.1 MAG: hypothetical protein A3F49_00550 [Candidatus Nomurabacteria bacterium RIFCSPHIGHO2_12_FULL_42_19]OGI94179.1 MAG: hypothetical protein A3A07_00260 [Candidatus Nomurabacteria bacterium RIFCSPLOWO2_01_FULL_41_52]OGI98016.1 MAG: hypothetical protein A3H56_02520 [Candid